MPNAALLARSGLLLLTYKENPLMLYHPTVERLAELRLTGMRAALLNQQAWPTSRS